MLNIRQFQANFYLDKNDDFSSNFFSDLKLGIFLQKLGKKILFCIGNITQ